MCRSKHVEQLRNIGIINSTTLSHLVAYFYKIHNVEVCLLPYIASPDSSTLESFTYNLSNVILHIEDEIRLFKTGF